VVEKAPPAGTSMLVPSLRKDDLATNLVSVPPIDVALMGGGFDHP
jgi:hypothetical protein